MKLKVSQLRRIIKEETNRVLLEKPVKRGEKGSLEDDTPEQKEFMEDLYSVNKHNVLTKKFINFLSDKYLPLLEKVASAGEKLESSGNLDQFGNEISKAEEMGRIDDYVPNIYEIANQFMEGYKYLQEMSKIIDTISAKIGNK